MLKSILLIIIFIIIYFNYEKIMPTNKITLQAPIAEKIDHEFEIHGQKIRDEYSWLRAEGWPGKITDQKVLSYLHQENDYFNSYMKAFDAQTKSIFDKLKAMIKLSDQSTYTKKDNYYYYTRTEEDKNYPIHCRKFGSPEAPEEIILDINELAKGKKFTQVASVAMSPDHKLMAYSVDFTGGERYDIYIYNLESKTFLPDIIPQTSGEIVWRENMEGIFYIPTTENWRRETLKFHKLGHDLAQDQVLFHEPDPLYSVSIDKSSSREYLLITVHGHDSNEIYYIDMQDDDLAPNLITGKQEQIRYSVDHANGYFYQVTNDGAKNFHLLRAKSSGYEPDDVWEIYVAENDNYLDSFDLNSQFVLLNYRNNGLPELVVQNINTRAAKRLKFPDASYTASIYSSNFEENDIRVRYSSLARPMTVYEYDFARDHLSVLKTQEIPSGFDPEEYQVEWIWAKSGDVMVPISLFYKKSLFKKDGSNPLYLYGYGSYGISVKPSFRNHAVLLADQGFVYAIAHTRGGDDLGFGWYEAAKFLTKKRSFDDFLAAAEHLIANKYSSKGNITIAGGSAGGMLIGASINQKPELFKAAIAHVPFVDVLNTMLDGDLPLTPGEYKEWGNPQEKEYFEYMKSYSPYDNISKQAYPNLLVTAGLSDPRVGYWEAAKWVARIRAQKTDDNVIIYKTNMDFGHAGASGRFDYLQEIAEELSFVFSCYNM